MTDEILADISRCRYGTYEIEFTIPPTTNVGTYPRGNGATNQPPIKLRTYVPNSRGNSAFLLSAHGQSCRVVLRHMLSHKYRRYQIFHKAWGVWYSGGGREQETGLGPRDAGCPCKNNSI